MPQRRDPLRAIQAAAGVLTLAAVAACAAPDGAIGLQHGRPDAVLARQEERGGQAGETRTDDDDIGVDVAADRTVVGRGMILG